VSLFIFHSRIFFLVAITFFMGSLSLGQNIPKGLATQAPPSSAPGPQGVPLSSLSPAAAAYLRQRLAPQKPQIPAVPTGPQIPVKMYYGPPAPATGAEVPDNPHVPPSDLLSGIIEDYTYNPANRRDPFLPYESINSDGSVLGPLFPLQKFDVDQLKLIGIIWDVKSPKAMILDPTGKGYVVKANERVGRHSGYIAKIRENEIVIVEMFKGSNGVSSYVTKFLRLSNE